MVRFKTGVVAFLACVLVHASAWAAGDFSRGLFWQVTPPQGTPSWVVGAIHVGEPRVEARIATAEKLLGPARRLVLELDRKELLRAASLVHSSGDAPFSRSLSVQRTALTRSALLARGVDETTLDRMPTWVAILLLSLPPKAEPGMDLRLLTKATEIKRPIFGLESAEEQVDVFRALPQDVQVAMLTWLVDHPNELNYSLSRILDAYAAQDLARLFDLSFETTAPETLTVAQQAQVLDRLINQRNVRMVERMLPHLKSGRALIAVGALHLPGILRELDAAGYTIERVER